jgi:DNA-binding LacI/PurR family transcriptional regulator
VRQPLYEMGQRGIELLLSMLEKPLNPSYSHWIAWQAGVVATGKAGEEGEQGNAAQAVHIQLPMRLIVRASCGANYSIPTRLASTQENEPGNMQK